MTKFGMRSKETDEIGMQQINHVTTI